MAKLLRRAWGRIAVGVLIYRARAVMPSSNVRLVIQRRAASGEIGSGEFRMSQLLVRAAGPVLGGDRAWLRSDS